jgi:hypothetical protein
VELRRAAVLIAFAGVAASVCVTGALAEREVVRQPTHANLVGPLVARAHSLVTLRGSIWRVSSGNVVIQSRSAATTKWRTLTRLALKSDGTFLVKTRVGGTGTQGRVRIVYYGVVFAGDATHLPSRQTCLIEIV